MQRRAASRHGAKLQNSNAKTPNSSNLSACRTCNKWVAQALRSAGCPITPFYALTADNVIYQVAKFGTVVRRHL